jgi:hypothetical protein
MFNYRRLASICAAAALSAASTFGQPAEFPYQRIEVVLNGASCDRVPDKIFVVLDAGDRTEFPLWKIGKNKWAADPGPWLPKALGSVRWDGEGTGGKRTECLKDIGGTERTNILRFTFSRCYEARAVTFDTDPGRISSRYVRELGPCREPVNFNGSETAHAVGFNIEDLRLQFGPPSKLRGLLVNAVAKSKKKKEFVVTRDWVAHALSKQRGEGEGAKSTNASNAIDLDLKNLDAIHFKSVTVGLR